MVPRELPVLLGNLDPEPETLLLIGEPVGGAVTVRRSTAADWSAAPVAERRDTAALLRWLESEAARGRRMNQSLYGLRLWLDGLGAGARAE